MPEVLKKLSKLGTGGLLPGGGGDLPCPQPSREDLKPRGCMPALGDLHTRRC